MVISHRPVVPSVSTGPNRRRTIPLRRPQSKSTPAPPTWTRRTVVAYHGRDRDTSGPKQKLRRDPGRRGATRGPRSVVRGSPTPNGVSRSKTHTPLPGDGDPSVSPAFRTSTVTLEKAHWDLSVVDNLVTVL